MRTCIRFAWLLALLTLVLPGRPSWAASLNQEIIDLKRSVAQIEADSAAGLEADLTSTDTDKGASLVANVAKVVNAKNYLPAGTYAQVQSGAYTTLTNAQVETTLQTALATAIAMRGILWIPAGFWQYTTSGDELLEITDTVTVAGAGKRQTILLPQGTTAEWAITINDCWRDSTNGESIDSNTVDFDYAKSGVVIRDLSIIGDRSVNTTRARGIRTYARVDQLNITNVDIAYLNGTGFSLGREGGAPNLGLVRESNFLNLFVRKCGNASEPGWVITTGTDAGDGTNQLHFYGFRSVYNQGTPVITSDHATQKTRRIVFHAPMIHGWNTNANAPMEHIMEIKGQVYDVQMWGAKLNGSHAGSAQDVTAVQNVSTTTYTVACVGHGFAVGTYVTLAGTTNFNKHVRVTSVTDADNFRFTHDNATDGDETGLSATATAQYGAIHFDEDASGDKPSGIQINGHITTSQGHGYVVGNVNDLRLTGAVDASTIQGNEVLMDVGGVAQYSIYDVTGVTNGRSIQIASGIANRVQLPVTFNTQTTANISDASHAINDDNGGRYIGKHLWNSTNNTDYVWNGTVWRNTAGSHIGKTTSLNPSSLAYGAGETLQVTDVTGAALGDFVMVTAPYDLQGLTVTGYVQTSNTVEIRIQNESGSTVDLGSGTWEIRVMHFDTITPS